MKKDKEKKNREKFTNKVEQNKKLLLEALEKSLGVISTAVKKVGLSRSCFYKYIEQDEEFKKAVKEIEEASIDFVESALFKQIKEGNTTATIFFLKTRGKKRGYVERTEITGVDGSPVIKLVRFEDKQK